MSNSIDAMFGPFLRGIFAPTNAVFDAIPEGLAPVLAKTSAVALFVGAMAWVWFGLKSEYVNLDAPSKKPWHDLRFWTVVSMAPHVLVYLYF